MDSVSRKIFDSHVAEWGSYVRSPLGAIRQELTRFVLATYLPEGDEIKRVLDAGCGLGEMARSWLEKGCQVYLCDFAPAMLAAARESLLAGHSEWTSLLRCVESHVEELPRRFDPGFFDLIFCHTLLEYVEDPQATIRQLAGLLRVGGFFSCVIANRFSEAWHLAVRAHDPEEAAAALERGVFSSRLFQNMPQTAFSSEEVVNLLARSSLKSCGEFGLRIFADFFPAEQLQEADFFRKVIELEHRALSKDPFRQLARYIQVLARKEPEETKQPAQEKGSCTPWESA
ncbi:MAG: methyltransferase domain-containing protein [Planctomycetaceae bacterium]